MVWFGLVNMMITMMSLYPGVIVMSSEANTWTEKVQRLVVVVVLVGLATAALAMEWAVNLKFDFVDLDLV